MNLLELMDKIGCIEICLENIFADSKIETSFNGAWHFKIENERFVFSLEISFEKVMEKEVEELVKIISLKLIEKICEMIMD